MRARVLLPAPFGPEDGSDRSGGHLERDAEEGLGRPVADVEVLDGQERLGSCCACSGRRASPRWLRPRRPGRPTGTAASLRISAGVPDGDELAEVEHEDVARKGEHRGDVVFDHEERHPALVARPRPGGRPKPGSRTPACRGPRGARRAGPHRAGWPGPGPPRPAGWSRAAGRPPGPWPPWSGRAARGGRRPVRSPPLRAAGASGVDHVPPQPLAGEANPVGQHQVLADGQAQEQLGLLKGPGQAPAGAALAGCAW